MLWKVKNIDRYALEAMISEVITSGVSDDVLSILKKYTARAERVIHEYFFRILDDAGEVVYDSAAADGIGYLYDGPRSWEGYRIPNITQSADRAETAARRACRLLNCTRAQLFKDGEMMKYKRFMY